MKKETAEVQCSHTHTHTPAQPLMFTNVYCLSQLISHSLRQICVRRSSASAFPSLCRSYRGVCFTRFLFIHLFMRATGEHLGGAGAQSRSSEQLRWIHKKKQISDRDAPGVGCLILNNVKKHFRRTSTKRFSSILSSWLMHSWMTYGFMGRQANQAVW